MAALTPLANYDGTPSFEACLELWTAIECSYTGNKDALQQLLDTCGGGVIDMWHYEIGSLPPGWSLFHQGNHYYVAIAGTCNVDQIFTHIIGGANATITGDPAVYVNSFFNLMGQLIFFNIITVLTGVPDVRITVTGHSYGAAVGHVLANKLADRFGPTQVELLAVAQPKTYSKGYAGAAPAVHIRLQRYGDPVPHMPPALLEGVIVQKLVPTSKASSKRATWWHYGQAYILGEDGSISDDLGEYVGGWLDVSRIGLLGFAPHLPVPTTQAFVFGANKPGAVTERGFAVAQIVDAVAGGETSQEARIDTKPSTYRTAMQANTTYFGSPEGPITQATLDSPSLLAVQIVSTKSGILANISGASAGGNMATTIWKFTAIIKAGDRSKSTSVVCNMAVNAEAAKALAFAWAKELAATLGNWANSADPPEAGGSARSPSIPYVRVTDALFPRTGKLKKPPAAFTGPSTGSTNANYADFVSTALSLRVSAVPDDDANKIVYSNHAFVGIPDKVVVNGDEINLGVFHGPTTYSNVIKGYLNYLTNTTNKLGCLTIKKAEKEQVTGPWTVMNGLWGATLAAHGYSAKDRLRLTAVKVPGFAGTYRIGTPDANTITLVDGPPTSIAGPKQATVRRVQLADGTRPMVFAQFLPTDGVWVDPFDLKVSKANPAKGFSPLASRRRKRKAR